jgi:hypothetical protein
VQKKQRKLPFSVKATAQVVYVPIPAKYSKPTRSGLHLVVVEGRQAFDIDLK